MPLTDRWIDPSAVITIDCSCALVRQVVVVTEQFEGKALIQRHRMVNAVLEDELATGVHALSIQGKTPAQWANSAVVQPSPSCQGGMKKDPTKRAFLESLKADKQ